MAKWIGTFVLGVAFGTSAVLVVQRVLEAETRPVDSPPVPPRQGVAPEPVGYAAGTPVVDPLSLARIQELPSEFERSAALYDRVRSADAGTVEALLEEAAALEQVWPKRILYSRYVDLAPRAAVNHILAQGRGEQARGMSALRRWAARDLDAALAYVDTLDDSLRTQAVISILSRVDDIGEARQHEIARRFSVESHLARIQTLADAATDPSNAWQRALALEPGSSRSGAMWEIANGWLDQDPASALTALADIADEHLRKSWQRNLLTRWVMADRRAPLQWLLEQPPSAARRSLVAHVSTLVAEKAPREVLEFAEKLDPQARREVAAGVLHVWAKTDPVAAVAALDAMADPRLAQMAERTLAGTWARSDPMAALDWARPKTPSAHRSRMLSTVLATMAVSDPVQAAALAGDLDASSRTRAIEGVLGRWAQDEPRAAVAWLDASPHKTPGMVGAVVDDYAKVDIEGAFEWLGAQSVEAQHRSARSLVREAHDEPPETVLRLIDQLDPAARAPARSRLVSKWAEQDPARRHSGHHSFGDRTAGHVPDGIQPMGAIRPGWRNRVHQPSPRLRSRQRDTRRDERSSCRRRPRRCRAVVRSYRR